MTSVALFWGAMPRGGPYITIIGMDILWQFCDTAAENTALMIMPLIHACRCGLLGISSTWAKGDSDMLQTASKLLGSVIVVLAAQPAFATPVAVPAPEIGGGLPGLMVVGGVLGAIWLVRMRRRHRTD